MIFPAALYFMPAGSSSDPAGRGGLGKPSRPGGKPSSEGTHAPRPTADEQKRAGHRDNWGVAAVTAATEAVAAEIGAAAAKVLEGVIIGDEVVYQRHCPSQREGSPAQNFCGRIKANACKSKNIPCERGV